MTTFSPSYLAKPLRHGGPRPAQVRADAIAKRPDMNTLGHHIDLAFRSNA